MTRRLANVAIGFYRIGRCDRIKDMLFMIKPKYENWTCTFNSMATAHWTVVGSRLSLATIPTTHGDQKAVPISCLPGRCRQNGAGINLLTPDHEFYTHETVRLPSDRDIRF